MSPYEVRDRFQRFLECQERLTHAEERLRQLDGLPQGRGIPALAVGSPGHADSTATVAAIAIDIGADVEAMRTELATEALELVKIIRGVRACVGLVAGDILEDHYLRGFKFDAIARMYGIGRTTVQRKRREALEWIATVGYQRAAQGVGIAT